MKVIDQPDAKLKIWAQNPKPARLPRIANLPHFGHKKFNSHLEFNAWKQALLLDLIRSGGAKWTR